MTVVVMPTVRGRDQGRARQPFSLSVVKDLIVVTLDERTDRSVTGAL